MIPRAWPPVPPLYDISRRVQPCSHSNNKSSFYTCPALRRLYITQKTTVEKAPQQIPLHTDGDSADPILQDAKRAYYESGTAYFEEARRYYARLNEDIKKYDERMVIDIMYVSMNSETEDDYIERQSFYRMYYYCLGFNFTSLNVPTM